MNVAAQIAEIQQVRSDYQLRHFVIGQHLTPEMRYYQCCIELQDMEFKLAHATLGRRRTELQIAQLLATGDPIDAIDAEIKTLELGQQALAEIGARREVECLRTILAEMVPYTRAEIEAAQPDYWQARLCNQADLQQLGAQRGIGWAHLEAMYQTGLITSETLPLEIQT